MQRRINPAKGGVAWRETVPETKLFFLLFKFRPNGAAGEVENGKNESRPSLFILLLK
jgi:hypothetical protein